MRIPSLPAVIVASGAVVALLLACAGEPAPTTADGHGRHGPDPLLAKGAAPEIQRTIAELRRWSASFHDLEAAGDAGYTVNLGCIDETLLGVPAATARGMGYHVTRGDVDLINDGVVDIRTPELLVYAPHVRDAEWPKAERLGKARLVGFDYYLPDPERVLQPPEFFGEPFNYSEAFQGWVRHIYLWGHNPEGMFEDYNAAVPLCTELLSP